MSGDDSRSQPHCQRRRLALFLLPSCFFHLDSPLTPHPGVQNANNTLAWTGTGPTAFAVWLSNPDATLIPADVKLKTFSGSCLPSFPHF